METLYSIETFKIRLAVAEPNLDSCHSAEEAGNILRPLYADLDADQEHFSVLLLNNKNRVRAFKVISSGSLTASLVHPREVFRSVILYGAAGIVLCHNHPSGVPDPSPEDIDITRRLKDCADIFGVQVMDHVILGKDTHFSFYNKGMLNGSNLPRVDYEDIGDFLWTRGIKRRAIAAALNYPEAKVYSTLRGSRKVATEIEAIAEHLKITPDRLNLLIAGKAPRTEIKAAEVPR